MYFWHTGILTYDIEKTLDILCELPGTDRDKWTIFEVDFPDEEMVTGDGGRLRVAIGRIGGTGGVVYELLQPMDDKSYHAKKLKERGPGVHHGAYVCEEGQKETVAALLERGGKIVWECMHGDERCCYVECNGTVMEIINVCPFMPE